MLARRREGGREGGNGRGRDENSCKTTKNVKERKKKLESVVNTCISSDSIHIVKTEGGGPRGEIRMVNVHVGNSDDYPQILTHYGPHSNLTCP